jgi:hypothetical protein
MLAETLQVEPDEVGHLDRLGAARLRELREGISNALFDAQATSFSRVSRLAPLVPDALVAKLAEAVVPPLVAGRIAGTLGIDHPGRVEGVLSHVSPNYMADCARYVDPRAVAVLAPIIPANVLVPAANVLLRRRDYITTSRFLTFLTPQLISDLEQGIDDDAGLLMTAALIESDERLSEIVRILPETHVREIIATAVETSELLIAGLSLLARLDGELQTSLADIVFDVLDPSQTSATIQTILEHDAIAELLTLAAAASPAAVAKLAADPVMADPATRRRFAMVATEHDLAQGLRHITEPIGQTPALNLTR